MPISSGEGSPGIIEEDAFNYPDRVEGCQVELDEFVTAMLIAANIAEVVFFISFEKLLSYNLRPIKSTYLVLYLMHAAVFDQALHQS